MKALVQSAKGSRNQKYWVDQVETAIKVYEEEAQANPGPQRSLSVALDILERYETLLEAIKTLRARARLYGEESRADEQIDGLVARDRRSLVLQALDAAVLQQERLLCQTWIG